jgi:hypothetical protein
MFRNENSVKAALTLGLSQPAFEALSGGGAAAPDRAAARMEAAIRCYLSDKGNGRLAWPYPGFLRESKTHEDVQLELSLESELWDSFATEAQSQGVSEQQLAEHAAFYLAAEIDAGRITQRILDDLESGEGQGKVA